MTKIGFKKKAESVTVSFPVPAIVEFDDYHEIEYFAEKLTELLGRKVTSEEGGLNNTTRKYKGIFTLA